MEKKSCISEDDIVNLISLFARGAYTASTHTSETDIVLNKCRKLLHRDNEISVISNVGGDLCDSYPFNILVPRTKDKHVGSVPRNIFSPKKNNVHLASTTELREYTKKATLARCRRRFPAPVILVDGKYICRSATLATYAESTLRATYDYIHTIHGLAWYTITGHSEEPVSHVDGEAAVEKTAEQLTARECDKGLLKFLGVTHICDLMVEKNKIKYGLKCSDSEKIDEDGYGDFKIVVVPYPGCEFFAEVRKNRSSEGLHFDWNQAEIDAVLTVPDDRCSKELNIKWNEYKKWELNTLTQNYLKLMLSYLADCDTTGLLVHCISGWDRTPLFISLLRLSLWADGVVHQSLDTNEILYLTIAYDWFLFGHNLKNRVKKKEDVFLFCFDFLKFITSSDYSFQKLKDRHLHDSNNSVDATSVESSSVVATEKLASSSIEEIKVHVELGEELNHPFKAMEISHQAPATPIIENKVISAESTSPFHQKQKTCASAPSTMSPLTEIPPIVPKKLSSTAPEMSLHWTSVHQQAQSDSTSIKYPRKLDDAASPPQNPCTSTSSMKTSPCSKTGPPRKRQSSNDSVTNTDATPPKRSASSSDSHVADVTPPKPRSPLPGSGGKSKTSPIDIPSRRRRFSSGSVGSWEILSGPPTAVQCGNSEDSLWWLASCSKCVSTIAKDSSSPERAGPGESTSTGPSSKLCPESSRALRLKQVRLTFIKLLPHTSMGITLQEDPNRWSGVLHTFSGIPQALFPGSADQAEVKAITTEGEIEASQECTEYTKEEHEATKQ